MDSQEDLDDRPAGRPQPRRAGRRPRPATCPQLVHQEVELAKVEIKRRSPAPARAPGCSAAPASPALFALVFLSHLRGLRHLLARRRRSAAAFFTVGLLYLVAAAVLALTGKKKISQVGPPERTIETVKDDIAWAKNPTHRRAASARS